MVVTSRGAAAAGTWGSKAIAAMSLASRDGFTPCNISDGGGDESSWWSLIAELLNTAWWIDGMMIGAYLQASIVRGLKVNPRINPNIINPNIGDKQ